MSIRTVFYAIVIFAAGCLSQATSLAGNKPKIKMWELGVPVDQKPAVLRIEEGTSSEKLVGLIGEPKEKKNDKKDASIEIWTFVRRVQFGFARSGRAFENANGVRFQPNICKETVKVTFVEGKVKDMRIHRLSEAIAGEEIPGIRL